jgi:hypothetical protein
MSTTWPTIPAIAMLLLMGWPPKLAAAQTVPVMPGPGKTLAQFDNDESACLAYAQNQTQPEAQAANSPNGTVARGMVRGTAAGALFGAAGGNAGKGAAIGAGVGLIGGSIRRARQEDQAAQYVQQSYNIAYAQCMKTKGNTIPPGAFN